MEMTDGGFGTNQTVAIIGLGLIGGSYAKGLHNLGVRHIIAVDPDTAALEQAKRDGVIEAAYTCGNEALRQADLVIFCMASQIMIRFLADNRHYFKRGALLTDVAGIKGHTAETIAALLPAGVAFVPGHPMAGREGQGYGMASADIFRNANDILGPMPQTGAEQTDAVAAMAKALGCAHVVRVTPEEHDRLIAYTSSLPHVLATSLVNSEAMTSMTKYFIAGSFRDGSRVADINAPLWTNLFLANKENLLYEIDRFSTALQQFATLLQEEDRTGICDFLQQAAVRRRELIHETHTR